MKHRWATWLFLLVTAGPSFPQPVHKTAPVYRIEAVSSPAAGPASAVSLTRAADDTVWLTWLEPAAALGQHTLRCASFDPPTKRWGTPREIARSGDWDLSSTRTPTLTVGPNHQLTAAWTVKTNGRAQAVVSQSSDAGATWSVPSPLSRASHSSSSPALVTLADGRVLAAWIGRPEGSTIWALFSRVFEPPLALPDVMVSPHVNEASGLALTAFPDGSALLSYRGHTRENIHDVHVARFSHSRWNEPQVLNSDQWRSAESPASSPRLASDGGRVSAAWFSAADGESRVLLSTSADAGAHFLLPMRADQGRATGHVDTILLHNGAALVTWAELPSSPSNAESGKLWLRRVSPQSALDDPVLLSASGLSGTAIPRAILLHDFSGDHVTAELLIAHGSSSGLKIFNVTVPESELLAAATEACGCGGPPAQLLGFPFRGTLVTPLPAEGVLIAKHPELPGLLPAGTHRFRAGPSVIATIAPGREFIGHVERRSGEWWLFDVRALVAPPTSNAPSP